MTCHPRGLGSVTGMDFVRFDDRIADQMLSAAALRAGC